MLLEVSEKEVAIQLSIGPVKTCSGLEPYRDSNPISTSPSAVDLTTAQSGPVENA